MERLIELIVHKDGSVTEEVEKICCMTGFRTRQWILYFSEGNYYRASAPKPS